MSRPMPDGDRGYPYPTYSHLHYRILFAPPSEQWHQPPVRISLDLSSGLLFSPSLGDSQKGLAISLEDGIN
jgi:hypothetical protein